jgi:hypothetical protein
VIFAAVVTAVAISGYVTSIKNKRVLAAQKASEAASSSPSTTAQFTADGKLTLPVGRKVRRTVRGPIKGIIGWRRCIGGWEGKSPETESPVFIKPSPHKDERGNISPNG